MSASPETARRQRGPFLKPCPCTPGAVSCGLANANLYTGCPYRCSYCILQEYLESTTPLLFRNWRSLAAELEALSGEPLRVTSGELADSLATPPAAMIGRLLTLLERFPKIVFEFKTKSDRVAPLLAHPCPLPQVVISWSLAPAVLVRNEEQGTPSLDQRLSAMAAAASKGFKIGIHLDPLILLPSWRSLYSSLVGRIARAVPAGRIAWWSLGALRFNPALRSHIFRRKSTRLFWGELVPGFDGKLRYFKPLRLELFRHLLKEIQNRVSTEVPLYLCMEEEEAWRHLLPGQSHDPAAINRRLYESALKP